MLNKMSKKRVLIKIPDIRPVIDGREIKRNKTDVVNRRRGNNIKVIRNFFKIVWVYIFLIGLSNYVVASVDVSLYCTSAGNAADEHIATVQVGSFNHESQTLSAYTDFTDITVNLNAGGIYDVTLAQGNGAWKEYWNIWIDYNQDENFTDEEKHFIGDSTSSLTGSITIPDNALLGETLMRVSMKYNSEADACEHFGYGDVQDYSISINSGNTLQAISQNTYMELDTKLPIKLTGTVANGGSKIFELLSLPNAGTLLGSAPNFNYVLNDPTYTGTDSFSFRVGDGNQWSTAATVNIQVRDNSVSSHHVGGPSNGIFLHIPNHLIYKDIGANNFDLDVVNNEDPLDETVRRVALNNQSISVNLNLEAQSVPYTMTLKWIPDVENSSGTLFQSESLSLSQDNGIVKTVLSSNDTSSNTLINTALVKTGSCNHATVVVESNQLTTYVNGIATTISLDTAQDLEGALQIGNYDGRLWDLRVYDHALTSPEVILAAEDCTSTRATPYPDPAEFNEIDKPLTLYRCGVYMCEWYSHEDGLSEEDLVTYLYDQDWFYEHNLFSVGMNAHGDVGGYFEAGRPGWQTSAKSRDLMLNERWLKYAKKRDRLNNGYWVHEDFHQYQGVLGVYTGNSHSKFFVEASAEWASSNYSPGIELDLLVHYTNDPHLPMWASNGSSNPMYNYHTIDGLGADYDDDPDDNNDNGGHQYGAYIFLTFLTDYVHSRKLIGDVGNHELASSAPVGALYQLLAEVGVDMRDAFIDFAARVATWDMDHGESYRASDEKYTPRLNNDEDRSGIDENFKYTGLYSEQGSGDDWISLPAGYSPGAWGYNLFKVENISGERHYAIEFKADESLPEYAEFRAKVVVFNTSTKERSYYELDVSDKTNSASVVVSANNQDEVYLVVATTPSTVFSGYEQFNYQYKIQNTNPDTPQLFLMAGQSNMEGHIETNFFNDLYSDLFTEPSDTLLARLEFRINDWYENYDDGYANYAASEEVAAFEASELVRLKGSGIITDQLLSPLNDVWCSINSNDLALLSDNCGYEFGPELSLGHFLSVNSGVPTSLIKVADGGTTLHTDWLSPTAAASQGKSVGPQYTQLILSLIHI